jgi:hypothetical protein
LQAQRRIENETSNVARFSCQLPDGFPLLDEEIGDEADGCDAAAGRLGPAGDRPAPQLDFSEPNFHRWKKQHVGLEAEQVRNIKRQT